MAMKSSSVMFVVLVAALASSFPKYVATLGIGGGGSLGVGGVTIGGNGGVTIGLPLPPLLPPVVLPPVGVPPVALPPVGVPPVGAPPGGLSAIVSPIGNLTQINGTVTCTVNATVNGTPAPPFANATAALQCYGTTVVSTTTSSNGSFILLVNALVPISTVVQNCDAVVTTPLINCNATLPSTGVLVSPLLPAGNGSLGSFPVTYLTAPLFQFVN